MHPHRFPGESDEYRKARDELLTAERELRRRTEEVAAQRRRLPPGGDVPQDYAFEEHVPDARGVDASHSVRLSELFGPHDALVLYHWMYGPQMANACPMCSSFLDALHGNAQHLQQRVALAVVARSPLDRLRAFAEPRGWRHFRLLSAARSSFSRDYFAEDDQGAQHPMLVVFARSGERIRHFWSSELHFLPPDPGQNERHLDPLWPLWNVLDLTPGGRGAHWYPELWPSDEGTRR
jgi:predicted dithiol-disulfide oxidoreductase (DUF899 family)